MFCRIAGHEVPAEVVYEDDEVMAFRDINPQAPVHVLVIPKRHIGSVAQASPGDERLLGRLMMVVAGLASDLDVREGSRVVANCGEKAGQSVRHLHLHLLGGRVFRWPPG